MLGGQRGNTVLHGDSCLENFIKARRLAGRHVNLGDPNLDDLRRPVRKVGAAASEVLLSSPDDADKRSERRLLGRIEMFPIWLEVAIAPIGLMIRHELFLDDLHS